MVFLIIFGVGLFLAVVTFAIGELFEFGDADVGGAGEVGDVGDVAGASPFSSRILFVFVAAFGGVGFIASQAGMDTWASSTLAVLGGAMVAGGTFFLIVLPMARQQGSIHLSREDFVGLEGEVTVEIPEGGYGRVQVIAPSSGARVVEPAQSSSGTGIARGAAVRIVAARPGSVTVALSAEAHQGEAQSEVES